MGLDDLETAKPKRHSYKCILQKLKDLYNQNLPHKVRVLLASAISNFVMIWQVYTPSSPGSTLETIRPGPSNVYLRENDAG